MNDNKNNITSVRCNIPEDVTFEDLFNLEDIQRLQDEFALATEVASIITKPDGTPITRPSNFTHLCSEIIRKTDKGRINCYKSDAAIGQLNLNGPTVKPCMSGGLWDAGAGISVGGNHIANWLIGQVRDITQTEEKMRRYAREIETDEEDFIRAFHEVPAMSQNRFQNIAAMLFTLANQLSSSAYQNVLQNHLIANLKRERETVDRQSKELRASKQRLSAHFENTPLGVIEWSLDFKVVGWNSAAENIFGYSKEEAIGRTGLELLVTQEAHRLILPVWGDLISEKGGTRSTNINITKDGQLITCEWYNTTLSDNSGVVIGAASLVQDITEKINFDHEREKLQESLRQAQKMEAVGTLAGGIAHDFNNILSAIIGYTDLAREDLPKESPTVSSLNKVLTAGNRAKELVTQILAFSRQSELKLIPVQIHHIVNEALKLLRSSIPTTIEIRKNIDSQSGTVLSDATQIHQITMNLCTNAYHAMRSAGGVLAVTIRPILIEEGDLKIKSFDLTPGPYVEFMVSDTGIGMDRPTVAKIFNPYFTTKKKGEGTGLGLSVVHGIVKSYGGHITVYSEPGQGTTFRIYLPQIISDKPSDISERTKGYPTGNERALIVDDEEVLVNMSKMMLTSLGYDVTIMTSSSMALQIFEKAPDNFDFIISDMNMPKMNGAELIRRILKIRPDIPIILCTGFSELIDSEKASALGVKKFLMKPVLKRELAEAVREVLS